MTVSLWLIAAPPLGYLIANVAAEQRRTVLRWWWAVLAVGVTATVQLVSGVTPLQIVGHLAAATVCLVILAGILTGSTVRLLAVIIAGTSPQQWATSVAAVGVLCLAAVVTTVRRRGIEWVPATVILTAASVGVNPATRTVHKPTGPLIPPRHQDTVTVRPARWLLTVFVISYAAQSIGTAVAG